MKGCLGVDDGLEDFETGRVEESRALFMLISSIVNGSLQHHGHNDRVLQVVIRRRQKKGVWWFVIVRSLQHNADLGAERN